jgi:hypothetical protein
VLEGELKFPTVLKHPCIAVRLDAAFPEPTNSKREAPRTDD